MRGVRRRREMGVGVPKWGRVSLHILQKTAADCYHRPPEVSP